MSDFVKNACCLVFQRLYFILPAFLTVAPTSRVIASANFASLSKKEQGRLEILVINFGF